jgi:hypothetical protein
MTYMGSTTTTTDALLSVVKDLSLDEIEKRIADLDAVRAALGFLRRSLAAREKARLRQQHKANQAKKS